MKRMINITKIFTLLCLIMLFMLQNACNNNQTAPEYITIWFDDAPEYRTNNMEVAQNETPFSIILPTYLPEDINANPFFEGRLKTAFDNKLPLRIMYYRSQDDFDYILIEEYNKPINTILGENGQYIQISGIEVLERNMEIPSVSDTDEFIFLQGFSYSWNTGNTHISVSICDYQLDESRKIIESMINTIK